MNEIFFVKQFMPDGAGVMNVTKLRLIREIQDKISAGTIQAGDTEAIINGLFDQVSEHLNKGDKLSIPECSIRNRPNSQGKTHDSSAGPDGRGFKGLESRYFVVREFSLMFRDWHYMAKKCYQFSRKLISVIAIVSMYYLFTVLIGC